LDASRQGLHRDSLVRLVLAKASARFQDNQNQPEILVLDESPGGVSAKLPQRRIQESLCLRG